MTLFKIDKTFCIYAGVILASVFLVAKAVDFLLGTKGRSWIREYVIFHPWFYLESRPLLPLVQKSARLFEHALSIVFGHKMFSLRSLFITALVLLLFAVPILFGYSPFPGISGIKHHVYVVGTEPIGAPSNSPEIGNEINPSQSIISKNILNAGFLLVTYFLFFCSWSITRFLAKQIVKSQKIYMALSYWAVDVVGLIVLIQVGFFGLLLTIGKSGGGSILRFTGSMMGDANATLLLFLLTLPTGIHSILVAITLLLSVMELARRMICFVLDRVDESNKSPVTIIATSCAALGTLVAALLNLFK